MREQDYFYNKMECQFYNKMEGVITGEGMTNQDGRQTPPQPPITFADLITKVGGFGRYQKLTLFLLFVAACVCGQYTTITPFLFFQDDYQCSLIPTNFDSCLKYVCSLPLPQRAEFVPAPSMSTLANRFGDFRCSQESNTINVVILIMYVGIIVSYLAMSILGDYLGRRTFVIVGAVACILGTLFALFIKNIYLASVGLLLGVFGVQTIFGMSFNIVSQIVAEQYREYSMVLLQIFYSLGHLTDAGLYFWLRDWHQIFIYFFILPMALFFLFYLIIAVDTPRVLVTTLAAEQALTEFLWIAKVNGVEDVALRVQEIELMKELEEVRENQDQKASKFTVLDIFKYPSLRWMTVSLVIVQISICFLYFAPNLMLDQFQLSIFINGAVYGAATVLSTAVMYFVINKLERKAVAVCTFSITLVCSFVLVFVYRPKAEGDVVSLSSNIGILLAIFLITFSITAEWTFFYVYVTELYPTQVRVIGTSLVSLSAAITLSLASFIINGAINAGFSVMIVFSIFAVLSLVFTFCLPQTLDKKQSDFIEEFEQKISRRATQRETLPTSQPDTERVLKKLPRQSAD